MFFDSDMKLFTPNSFSDFYGIKNLKVLKLPEILVDSFVILLFLISENYESSLLRCDSFRICCKFGFVENFLGELNPIGWLYFLFLDWEPSLLLLLIKELRDEESLELLRTLLQSVSR